VCARFPSCQLREQLAPQPTEIQPIETEEKSDDTHRQNSVR
jgi:hypothetical protein